jgi:opacity protein-like surface antigen
MGEVTMTKTVTLTLAALLLVPQLAAAQPIAAWAPEVSVAAGNGHVFRYRDETYGDELNISGAFIMRHRRGLGFEIETNRTIGLAARQAPCGVFVNGAPVACTGSAREGVLSASSVSFNVHYMFGGRRVQPYLLGGLGVLRTRAVSSLTTVRDGAATQTEDETTATGLGPDVGAGLRVPIGRHVSITPEIRWLEAASLSRHNLAVTRASVRAAYSW